MNNYANLKASVKKSDKRLKVDRYYDSQQRGEDNERRREERAFAAMEKRVRQEKEDRERYIIPEFQDLEEQLTTHL